VIGHAGSEVTVGRFSRTNLRQKWR
jgi:hypothetical protein